MMQRIGMAIGAGLAAALLFAVMAKGTLLAAALACFAPLPIMIVTLGWGIDMGALAIVVAGAVVAALFEPLTGAIFALTIAAPIWLLSVGLSLPRDRLFARLRVGGEESYFPVGWIVAAAAFLGALLGVGVIVSLSLAYGGYQKGLDGFSAELASGLTEAFDGVVTLPSGVTVQDFATLFARLSPPVLAATTTLLLCGNLYLAARAVRLSQRLQRPWANVPEALILPPWLGVGLVICGVLAIVARGLIGHLGWIGLAALGCAYALQGLAVVHTLSRRLSARLPLLIIFYLVAWAMSPLALPALAILGLTESLLSLRARRAAEDKAKSRI